MILLSVSRPEDSEEQQQSLKELLQQVRQNFQQGAIQCDVLEKVGKPPFVICDVADELNVDLIIMGTRGVNLQENAESTAVRVIQLAPCPVLVVP